MKFGMSAEQFKILNDLLIQPLKDKGADVFIFGSRVTGRHHPFSDVDLMYVLNGQSQLPTGLISKLKEDLEESRFPFTVDLVYEPELAASYRSNVDAAKVKL